MSELNRGCGGQISGPRPPSERWWPVARKDGRTRVADRQDRPAAALTSTPVTHCTADDCVSRQYEYRPSDDSWSLCYDRHVGDGSISGFASESLINNFGG
jgi:hypothetical protein